MSDSTRRAIRTALDLIPAVLGALLILVPVMGLSAEQVTKVGAVVGALTLALAKIRNAAEDAGIIPALLKAPASDGADPVPDEAGHADLGAIALGVLIGVLIAWLLLH